MLMRDSESPPTLSAARQEAGGKFKLDLKGEQETLVINLYSRALDYRSRHSILNDAKASELVDRTDYDFEKLRSPGGGLLIARARQMDEWTLAYLGREQKAIVLNLGCGLDSRAWRLNPSPGIRWFDVDFPGVIELRRQLFSDRPGYRMIGSSVTEEGWLQEIPADGPGLVIGDGVFEYITGEDVRSLVHRLIDHFGRGQMIFDVASSRAMAKGNSRLSSTTEAKLRWAVDDLRQIDALDPRLRRKEVLSALGLRYFPLRYRLLYRLAILSSAARDAIRVVRCEF